MFALAKAILSLIHGNVPERGFSINKYLLSIHGNSINENEIITFKLLNVFGGPTKVKWKWSKDPFGERERSCFDERKRRERLANKNMQGHRVYKRMYPSVRKYAKGCKWWFRKSIKRKL